MHDMAVVMKSRVLQRALGTFFVITCLVWTASCALLRGMDVEEGRQRLEAILIATHRATAVELPMEKGKTIGPSECTFGFNWGLGTYHTTLYFAIELQGHDGSKLLQAIHSYWEEKGYNIKRRQLSPSQPELLGTTDGFFFRALLGPATGKVHLTGDTHCLSPAEES